MPRLFVPAARLTGASVRLTAAETRHLRAMRLRAGSSLTIFDDRNREHAAVVVRVGPREAAVEILATNTPSPGPVAPPITLIAAVLKGPRMDLLVEKVTELGASRVIPVLTELTVARPSLMGGGRTQRWRRLAISAATQCGTTRVPSIGHPVTFPEAVEALPRDALRLLFWEQERHNRLPVIRRTHPTPVEIALAIGAEGGFTRPEVDLAREQGFLISGLGPRTLRAETAAIVGVALCQATWGDLGR